MEHTIRRIGVSSVFKMSLVFYGITGVFIALIYALIAIMVSALGASLLGGDASEFSRFGAGVGSVAIIFGGIIFTVLYTVLCAAITASFAAMYNMLAAWIGGITVTLDAGNDSRLAQGPGSRPGIPVPPPLISNQPRIGTPS